MRNGGTAARAAAVPPHSYPPIVNERVVSPVSVNTSGPSHTTAPPTQRDRGAGRQAVETDVQRVVRRRSAADARVAVDRHRVVDGRRHATGCAERRLDRSGRASGDLQRQCVERRRLAGERRAAVRCAVRHLHRPRALVARETVHASKLASPPPPEPGSPFGPCGPCAPVHPCRPSGLQARPVRRRPRSVDAVRAVHAVLPGSTRCTCRARRAGVALRAGDVPAERRLVLRAGRVASATMRIVPSAFSWHATIWVVAAVVCVSVCVAYATPAAPANSATATSATRVAR